MSLRRMAAQMICNDANYVDDYTAPTWSLNSFDFEQIIYLVGIAQ